MITQDVSQTLTDSIACVGLSLSLVSRFLGNEVGALTFEAKCIVEAAVEIILGLDGTLLRHLVIVVQLLLMVLHEQALVLVGEAPYKVFRVEATVQAL